MNLASLFSATVASYSLCSDIGGRIDHCLARTNAVPAGYHMPARHYYSGGTWPVARAACIHSRAVFHFHAAHDPTTKVISDDGNALQRSVLSPLPNLLSYLDARGAFSRVHPHVVVTGAQAATIEPRLRLCDR